MSEGKDGEKTTESEDQELNELLDSALEDFSKKAEPVEKPEEADDYLKQAAAQFESSLVEIMSKLPNDMWISPDQLQQNAQKIAEVASEVIANPQPTAQNTDFASTITQTLQGLSLGAENLQNPFSEQDVMNMFGGMGEEDGGAFLPLIQEMMQSLLSKEVLYPSVKDMLDKFPAWLEENKSKLEPSEYERYMKQQNLMADVCAVLETEPETDDANVLKERFDKVLTLMHKMQDLGQPPSELAGDLGPGIQFDAAGNPMLPASDPSQCSLM